MKILTSSQMRQLDAYTIEHEPIRSIKLMERAARKCVEWIRNNIPGKSQIKVVCGLGNNGGDGLALAFLLSQTDHGRLGQYYPITIYIVRHSEKSSDDFNTNFRSLIKRKKKYFEINNVNEIPEFSKDDVVIDAIFGTGLTKSVEGFLTEVIKKVNESGAKVISIDLPTGLFSEDNSANNRKAIINADVVLTFHSPKLAFFLPENNIHVKTWQSLDIGLDREFSDSFDTGYSLIDKSDVMNLLKARNKFSHKGTYGHALLIAGSYGKMGAAILGAKAALRCGAGLVTTHIPKKGYDIMQIKVPEAMVSIDPSEEFISALPDIANYNALAIGPGIDKKEETQKVLKQFIQNSVVPLIFDADALNILAENKTWLAFVPKGSILTPHPKEFERLAGKPDSDFHRLQMQKDFSVKFGVYVIYKGAYSTISTPEGKLYFNSTGNPGMATGGSGDVLTGMLLGLKACGYTSFETCVLGTYLHGLAGDIARDKMGEESLIAGDIIKNIGEAFKSLKEMDV